MASRKRSPSPRFRVGKVSVYEHHGAWWLYYRENGRVVRSKVADKKDDAERIADQVNAQVTNGSPTLLSFDPISVADLRQQFLDYHEHVLNSALGTISRYRAATHHLVEFVGQHARQQRAHEVRPHVFAAYLRKLKVAPNGHKHSAKRRLRDNREELEAELRGRISAVRAKGDTLRRSDLQELAKQVWWDTGMVKQDVVRTSFIRIMKAIGHAEAT